MNHHANYRYRAVTGAEKPKACGCSSASAAHRQNGTGFSAALRHADAIRSERVSVAKLGVAGVRTGDTYSEAPRFSRDILRGGVTRLELPDRYRGARSQLLLQQPKQFRDLGPVPGIECTDEFFTIPPDVMDCVWMRVILPLNARYRMPTRGIAAAHERDRMWSEAFSSQVAGACPTYPRIGERLVQSCIRNAFRREHDNPFEVTETREECFERLGVDMPRPDQACREISVDFYPWGMRVDVMSLRTEGIRCNMRVCAG